MDNFTVQQKEFAKVCEEIQQKINLCKDNNKDVHPEILKKRMEDVTREFLPKMRVSSGGMTLQEKSAVVNYVMAISPSV